MTQLDPNRFDLDGVIPFDSDAGKPEDRRFDYSGVIPFGAGEPEAEALPEPPSTIKDFLAAKGVTQPLTDQEALSSGVVGEFVKSQHDYIRQLPEGDPRRLSIAKGLEPTERDLYKFNRAVATQRAAKTREDEPFMFGKTRGELERAITEPLGSLGGVGTVAGATLRGLATGSENLAGTIINIWSRGSSFIHPEDALIPLQVAQDREIMAQIGASLDDEAGLDKILSKRGADAYRGAMSSMPTVVAGSMAGGPVGVLGFIGAQAFDDGLTEATQNGIEGGGRYLFAGAKATTEVALTALIGKALGKLGISTLEESLSPGIRHSLREAFKRSGMAEVLKRVGFGAAGIGGEVLEERAIDSTNQIIELVAGTREDYDWDQNDFAGLTAIAGSGAAKLAAQVSTEFKALKEKIPDIAEGSLAAEQALEDVGVNIPRVEPAPQAPESIETPRDTALAEFTTAETVAPPEAPEGTQGVDLATADPAQVIAQTDTAATTHPLVEATKAAQQQGPAGRGARGAKRFIENVTPEMLNKALEPGLDQKQFAAVTGIKGTSEAFRESFQGTLAYYKQALTQPKATVAPEADGPLLAPAGEVNDAFEPAYAQDIREAATEFSQDDSERGAFMDTVLKLLKGIEGSQVITEQDQQKIIAAAKKFVDALTPDQRVQILAQSEQPKETPTVARERMTRDQRKLQTAQRKYQEVREQAIALRQRLSTEPREAIKSRQEAIGEAMDLIRSAVPAGPRQDRLIDQAVKARTPGQYGKLLKSIENAAQKSARRASVAKFQSALRYAKNLRSEFADIVETIKGGVDLGSKASRNRLKALSDHFSKNPDFPAPESVKRAFRRLKKTPIHKLSAQAIDEATDAILTAAYESSTKNKFLGLVEHGGMIQDTVRQVESEIDASPGFDIKPSEKGVDFGTKRKLLSPDAPAFQEWSSRPEDLFDRVSKTFSNLLWNEGMVKPEAKRLQWDNEHIEGMEAIFAKHNLPHDASHIAGVRVPNVRRDGWKLKFERTSPLETARTERIPIRDVTFTRDELTLVHRLMKDEENRLLMRKHGITFQNGNRSIEGITPEVESQIAQAIGPAFVEISDYVHAQDNGPTIQRANAASQNVHGHPVTLRTNHAPRPSVKDPAYDPKDPQGNAQRFIDHTHEHYGHLKERKQRSGPIVVPANVTGLIDFSIDHTAHMNRFSAYLAPYRDMTMVASSLKEKLIEKGGPKFFDYVMDRISRTAAPFVKKAQGASGWLESQMTDVLGGTIAGSGAAHVLSNLGLLNAASRYQNGGKMLRRAVADDANPARSLELGDKVLRSPLGKQRYKGDNFMREFSGGLLGRGSYFRPRSAVRIAAKTISIAEFLPSKIKMSMAEQVVEGRGIDRGTPEFEEESLREWERMMYRTENSSVGMEYNDALAQAQDSGIWARGIVPFMNAVSKQWSMLTRGQAEFDKGNRRLGATMLAYSGVALIFEAMARDLFSREKVEGNYPVRVAKRMLTGFPSMIPIIGPIVERAARQMVDMRTWPGETHLLLDGATNVSDSGGEAANAIVDNMLGGDFDPNEFQDGMTNIALTISTLFGLPLRRAMTTGKQIGGEEPGAKTQRRSGVTVNF